RGNPLQRPAVPAQCTRLSTPVRRQRSGARPAPRREDAGPAARRRSRRRGAGIPGRGRRPYTSPAATVEGSDRIRRRPVDAVRLRRGRHPRRIAGPLEDVAAALHPLCATRRTAARACGRGAAGRRRRRRDGLRHRCRRTDAGSVPADDRARPAPFDTTHGRPARLLRPGYSAGSRRRAFAGRARQLGRLRDRLALEPDRRTDSAPTARLRAGELRSGTAAPRGPRARAGDRCISRAGRRAAAGAEAWVDLWSRTRRPAGNAGGKRPDVRPDGAAAPVMTLSALLEKYDVPTPRYTSYPTVPQWHASPSTAEWLASLTRAAHRPDAALALYVHLPFCESLCSFCGCNTVITRDHGRERPYVDRVLAELRAYLMHAPAIAEQPFEQLHL